MDVSRLVLLRQLGWHCLLLVIGRLLCVFLGRDWFELGFGFLCGLYFFVFTLLAKTIFRLVPQTVLTYWTTCPQRKPLSRIPGDRVPAGRFWFKIQFDLPERLLRDAFPTQSTILSTQKAPAGCFSGSKYNLIRPKGPCRMLFRLKIQVYPP